MTARKRIFIAAIGVAAVLASGAFAWKATRAPASQVASRPAATARPLELIAQEVHTIKPRGLVDTVRFTGTTQPIDQTVVKARVAGRLAEVLVREGDKVTKGQVLARFETTELQAKVNERQSAVDAARAELRWASRDRSDKETLSARNIVSQSAADQARSTAENRTSMVAVSEAQLEVARKNLADAEVRAPFAGVVGERIANQGESLPIDGKIVALLDTSHVEIAAQMPAADVVRLQVGQAATISLEGFGERPVQRSGHAHQPDGAGGLAIDPRLCRDPRSATTACAAGCSARAPSPSRRRPTRWPCPPRRCARTTRATSC